MKTPHAYKLVFLLSAALFLGLAGCQCSDRACKNRDPVVQLSLNFSDDDELGGILPEDNRDILLGSPPENATHGVWIELVRNTGFQVRSTPMFVGRTLIDLRLESFGFNQDSTVNQTHSVKVLVHQYLNGAYTRDSIEYAAALDFEPADRDCCNDRPLQRLLRFQHSFAADRVQLDFPPAPTVVRTTSSVSAFIFLR